MSLMLDASGWQDDPRLQEYIDEWQAISDRIKDECAQRRLAEADDRGANLFNSSSNAPSSAIAYREVLPYSNTTALSRRALDDIEHRDERKEEVTLRVDRRRVQEEEKEIRGPRRKMFPYDIWPTIYFYRYQGQLTYPPCSEIVVWRVLDEPLVISRKQFKQLASLIASYTDQDSCDNASAASPKGETYRPIEQLNTVKQELTHCTAKDFTFWQYTPDQQ